MSKQQITNVEGKVIQFIEIEEVSSSETGENYKAVRIAFKNNEWLEFKFQANVTMKTARVA
jgi:hypothetical protein